jgi:hypothetical protein
MVIIKKPSQDVRLSQRRLKSSVLCYITPCSLVKANVSEEHIAFIFKVEEYIHYTADRTLQEVVFCT